MLKNNYSLCSIIKIKKPLKNFLSEKKKSLILGKIPKITFASLNLGEVGAYVKRGLPDLPMEYLVSLAIREVILTETFLLIISLIYFFLISLFLSDELKKHWHFFNFFFTNEKKLVSSFSFKQLNTVKSFITLLKDIWLLFFKINFFWSILLPVKILANNKMGNLGIPLGIFLWVCFFSSNANLFLLGVGIISMVGSIYFVAFCFDNSDNFMILFEKLLPKDSNARELLKFYFNNPSVLNAAKKLIKFMGGTLIAGSCGMYVEILGTSTYLGNTETGQDLIAQEISASKVESDESLQKSLEAFGKVRDLASKGFPHDSNGDLSSEDALSVMKESLKDFSFKPKPSINAHLAKQRAAEKLIQKLPFHAVSEFMSKFLSADHIVIGGKEATYNSNGDLLSEKSNGVIIKNPFIKKGK